MEPVDRAIAEREAPQRTPAPAPAPSGPFRQDAPATGGGLLALQASAGNQAVVGLLERQASADLLQREVTGAAVAPPTPPADAPPADTPPSAPAPAPVDRTAKNADGKTADDIKAIADPAAYLKDAGSKWNEARARFKRGWLGFVVGGDDGKGTFDASKGLGMNALIAYRLQATVLKKSDVSSSNSPMEQVKDDVAAKQNVERDAKQKALHDAGVQNAVPMVQPLDWNY